MREFTINRRRWDRGEMFADIRKEKGQNKPPSLKHPEDGRMCCLGIYLEACGVPVEKLYARADPKELVEDVVELPQDAQWLVYIDHPNVSGDETFYESLTFWWDNTGVTQELMEANDDTNRFSSEAEREQKIAELFKANDVIVHFED